ncbi:MAG: class I SAM-dependent rRNA methyltransferase [Chloroflexi bacterium]|nr:class I SAM-dependent rRNA methyltransferase [Chloroflexota bacterium]
MNNTTKQAVILKAERDKPVRQGHPWIFSGAIQSLPAAAPDGAIVPVLAADGKWLAQGYLNRASQIQVRLLSWDANEPIDESFWRRRLAQAIAARRHLAADGATTAYRLVNAESDYLPGLTVDRYADYLVMQVGTLGIEQRKHQLAGLLLELTNVKGVLERSEIALRRQEGLGDAVGLLAGAMPPNRVAIRELGLHFYVDLAGGQKSGFYMDQRENRRRLAAYCQGGTVLNAFSYTGAFAVHALAAGAQHVTNIDESVDALTLGEENVRLNHFDPDAQTESLAGDVFTVLHDWRDAARATSERPFDVIILDPPKFAQSKGNLERALRGYKDINLLAMQLLKPGGILATFSCSGLVSADLFQKVVFGAAVDANRPVQILEWLRQGSDHPIAITFPEGEYLKGLICRVL